MGFPTFPTSPEPEAYLFRGALGGAWCGLAWQATKDPGTHPQALASWHGERCDWVL